MSQLNDTQIFSATTFAISHISSILTAISSVSNKALVTIDEDGLNFITENSHISRIELTFEKGLFSTYQLNKPDGNNDNNNDNEEEEGDDEIKFTVELKPIVESLNLVSKNQISNTQCTISFAKFGDPFIFIFEDSKMIERCEFSTYINLELEANNLGFELNDDEIKLEGIIKADVLYDALKDLKDLNTEEILFYASNRNKKYNKFAIISKSDMGNSLLYLPNERSILEKLVVHDQVDISCFKFSMFNMILKAIKISNKCKFKRDESILSLNLLSLYGFDLPKNYIGTVIDFRILQLYDREELIDEFIKELDDEVIEEPLQIEQPHARNGNENYDYNNNQDDDNGGIDIPVFL